MRSVKIEISLLSVHLCSLIRVFVFHHQSVKPSQPIENVDQTARMSDKRVFDVWTFCCTPVQLENFTHRYIDLKTNEHMFEVSHAWIQKVSSEGVQL